MHICVHTRPQTQHRVKYILLVTNTSDREEKRRTQCRQRQEWRKNIAKESNAKVSFQWQWRGKKKRNVKQLVLVALTCSGRAMEKGYSNQAHGPRAIPLSAHADMLVSWIWCHDSMSFAYASLTRSNQVNTGPVLWITRKINCVRTSRNNIRN